MTSESNAKASTKSSKRRKTNSAKGSSASMKKSADSTSSSRVLTRTKVSAIPMAQSPAGPRDADLVEVKLDKHTICEMRYAEAKVKGLLSKVVRHQ